MFFVVLSADQWRGSADSRDQNSSRSTGTESLVLVSSDPRILEVNDACEWRHSWDFKPVTGITIEGAEVVFGSIADALHEAGFRMTGHQTCEAI